MNNLTSLAVDSILFELTSPDDADELCDLLQDQCIAWTERWEDVWVVGAELGEADSLAPLLRSVEEWVAERRLGAIRFSLDAKAYILQAGEVAWAGFAA